jgi:hypothetical protein
MGDSQPDKTVEYTGETARLDLGDIAAGTPKYVTYWFDRDTWVAGVDLIVGNGGVTQNDTNYATIELKNMNPVAGGGATVVKTVTTQTNGSGGTAMAQDALISMNGTTKFTGAGAYVAKGGALRIAVTHSGAGRDIPQLAARLRFIRCGAP